MPQLGGSADAAVKGMLSNSDTLIPLAPTPAHYQGKGGMFSSWW